jgi:hypothetical protein
MKSKKEAVVKVKQMLEDGLTNIDIGCMQINLHHHPDAFLNLNDAFEPKNNIEYAANFLIQNYNQSQNWQQAIAFYHSKGSVGQDYAMQVLKKWSDYSENKLNYTHCNAADGSVISCNNATYKDKISKELDKEKLPFINSADTNEVKRKIKNPKMDSKRLKSSMILYSIHNE